MVVVLSRKNTQSAPAISRIRAPGQLAPAPGITIALAYPYDVGLHSHVAIHGPRSGLEYGDSSISPHAAEVARYQFHALLLTSLCP